MKKTLIALVCLAVSVGVCGCVNKKTEIESEKPVTVNETIPEEAPKAAEETPEVIKEPTPERTEETDREEIKNNLRDARQLIEDECYDDAEMILKAIESRELTGEEQKELEELKKLLSVTE